MQATVPTLALLLQMVTLLTQYALGCDVDCDVAKRHSGSNVATGEL
jgi:hypothetical protein